MPSVQSLAPLLAACAVPPLAALALARRPPLAALTVLWQLRVPSALCGAALAGLAGATGRGPLALALAAAAAAVLLRVALEGRRPRPVAAPVGPRATLHVVTHNCGLHRSDPTQVAQFLADCGADLVAVQEIEPAHERALRAALGATHPHLALHATGVDGIGLASRWPLLEHALVRLDAAHPYLVARVDAPGGPLHVTVFHPSAALAVVGRRHAALRDAQRLASEAARNAPALLLGDLNSTDATEAWDAFAEVGLVDAFRAAGRGPGATFPVPLKYLGLPVPPLVRIDFVFATPDLAPASAVVGPPTTSDHLPLFATLTRTSGAGVVPAEAAQAG